MRYSHTLPDRASEDERAVFGLVAVGLGHRLLKLDSGCQRIDGTGEFDKRPVAGQLD